MAKLNTLSENEPQDSWHRIIATKALRSVESASFCIARHRSGRVSCNGRFLHQRELTSDRDRDRGRLSVDVSGSDKEIRVETTLECKVYIIGGLFYI